MFCTPLPHAAQAKALMRKSAGVWPQSRFPANLRRTPVPTAVTSARTDGQTDRACSSSGRSCWTESSGQTQVWIPEHVSLQHGHQAHKSRWTSALFINQRTLKAGIRIHILSMTIRSQKNRGNLQNSHPSDWQTMGTTGERFNWMNDVRFGLNWLPFRDF